MSFKSKCYLCSGPFKDPKLLPCFHTFCQCCLYEYVGKNSRNEHFQCPTCKQLIYVPKNIKTGFPNNYYVDIQVKEEKAQRDEYVYMTTNINMNTNRRETQPGDDIHNDSQTYVNVVQKGFEMQGDESVNEKFKLGNTLEKKTKAGDQSDYVICDVCPNDVLAEFACKECDQRICAECYHVHSSMGGTKQHVVLELKKPQIFHGVTRICETHKEPLRFYCKNCHEGICVQCKGDCHVEHPTEHVVEATRNGRIVLKRMQDSLSFHLRSLSCELEALSYRKKLIKNACAETVTAIKIHADEMCKQVYRIRDIKLQAAKEFEEEQLLNIKGIEKLIQDRDVQVTAMNDYVKKVFASGSDVGVLETCDQIKDKVTETENFVCPSVDVQCTEFDSKLPVSPSVDTLFGRINSYPALRMRLSYGPCDTFTCSPPGKSESVDAIFAIGNKMAWIATHGSRGLKSTVALYSSKGEVLDLLTCDQTVKCFSLLDNVLHVLTSDSFLKLNDGKSFLEPLVSESHPILIASNSTSMFCVYKDLTCHYVTNTSVKPIATTFLCSLASIKNPSKMAIDENQNIAIADTTLKSVVLFDFDGNVKLKYSITYPEFAPIDVWIDEWSDILVVDSGNDAIHELSSDGQGAEIMYTPFSGLKNTCCIGGDTDTWWFGSTNGKITVKYFDSEHRPPTGSSSKNSL